jgi:putative Ca2+/H+ antiporter (TMEM165/GDT1 family)
MLSIVAATYWTVLVAELVGDKCVYTIASLSTRLGRGPVAGAMAAAFAGKMLVAVTLAGLVARLPARWAAAGSAIVFFAVALALWIRERRANLPAAHSSNALLNAPRSSGPSSPSHEPWFPRAVDRSSTRRFPGAVLTAWAALFLTEWGDPGQLAAAAVAVRSGRPGAVWLGGTLALVTKGLAAITMGAALSRRVPEPLLRRAAVASCAVLGFFALLAAL